MKRRKEKKIKGKYKGIIIIFFYKPKTLIVSEKIAFVSLKITYL